MIKNNLSQLIDNYLHISKTQNKLNHKTIKAYSIDLKQFEKISKDEKLFYDKNVILRYITFLNNSKYKEKTIKRKIASIKAFFSYLDYENIIEINPFSKIRLKFKESFVLPKTISIENLNSLFQCVYSKKSKQTLSSYQYGCTLRNIAVLELLFGTGIRISELCELKTKNILLNQNIIKIYGKGAKERIIPIFNENIITALNEYINYFKDEIEKSEYFFLNKIKNKLSPQSVRNMIKTLCQDSHISTNITPHMFRHTFATFLLDSDVDTRNIQQLLGHSSILTTQIYTHVTLNKKSEIMKNKNPRLKLDINKG